MARFGGNGGGFDDVDIADIGRRAGDAFRRYVKWIVGGAVALILIFTTYYQVEPEEVGVVTRFGRYVHATQPGPHFKAPFGIDRVTKVPVQRQLKQEFGFRTVQADVRTQYERTEDSHREAEMLTGDLNVADVEWIVQYKIRDPYKFVFKVRNVVETFHDMTQAVMRAVVGDHSVTEVLTIGREPIQVDVKHKLQALCDRYETGIQVLQVVLQDVNPPEPVRPSFNEVNQAIQERERAINEAGAEYNRAIPKARGQAEQLVQGAEGYALERVNKARGDAERYTALQREYARAPQVTRTRIYLETLGDVLPASGKRVVIDSSLKGILPLLPLPGAGLGGEVRK